MNKEKETRTCIRDASDGPFTNRLIMLTNDNHRWFEYIPFSREDFTVRARVASRRFTHRHPMDLTIAIAVTTSLLDRLGKKDMALTPDSTEDDWAAVMWELFTNGLACFIYDEHDRSEIRFTGIPKKVYPEIRVNMN